MDAKDELRTRIAEAHDRFLAAFEGFDSTVLETEPVAGSWSARDIAGHLIDWGNEIVAAAEHVLGAPAPRSQPIRDGEMFNVMRAALRGADPWDLTAQEFRAFGERCTARLATLTDQELRRVGRMPWGEVGPVRRFYAVIHEHIEEHLADVQAWRDRKSGVKPRDERR